VAASDPNRKTVRQFRCRDFLWQTFEEMGRELGCSTDYLINEAMRLYARSREYGTQHPSIAPRPTGMPRSAPASGAMGSSAPPPGPSLVPPRRSASPPPTGYRPPPPPTGAAAPPRAPSTPPPPPSLPPPTSSGLQTAPVDLESPRQTIMRGNAVPRPAVRASVPPAPPPVVGAGTEALPPSAPTLHLVFNGERIPIDKQPFVIGRGSKTSDMAIKDGNISRRHCAVVFENGQYLIRDLGSTNGVEHGGQRIDQKEIDEGDIFQLCDYELRFTYR